MKVYKNLSITKKILFLSIIMIALQMVIFFMGFRTSRNIQKSVEEMYTVYVTPAMWILDAKSYAIQTRRVASRALDTEKENLGFVKELVTKNRKITDKLMEDYAKTIYRDEEKEIFPKIMALREDAMKKQDEIIAAAETGLASKKSEMYRRIGQEGDITATEAAYVAEMDKLASILKGYADEENENGTARARKNQIETFAVSLLALVTGFVLSVWIAKTIIAPVKKTEKSIVLFAKGDLDSRFDTDGRDEIAVMGRSLQGMATNLAQIIGTVKNASDDINNTSRDFSSLAEETNGSVEEFKANVDSMSTNLGQLADAGEQVNASVQEVASGAQATAERGTEIARKVDEAMNAGGNGMNAVHRTAEGIDGVAANASEAAKSVQELGERTKNIRAFVTRIGNIAAQTNLLALNAAIEAARAGDAGRGFAVVAEEVRKLAEESDLAAKSIEDLAKTIMIDLDGVVTISLDNVKASEGAKELSRETEETIKNILSTLSDISAATQDLAAISQEQAASSEEIAESVQSITARVKNTADASENIRDGVDDVAGAAERMALGANGLSSLAANLRETLDFFKLNDTARLNASKPLSLDAKSRRTV
ncbi:MAG: methyl-accepting chemotaxis protein [Synergistaceae bacterium]|jgi:methyl-accepting chemotaxis protein|nr:methyl-accepting chemotaxis protein [Synergistaceae bacterium]